ncbi:MAG: AAA family ATPase [Candidatus Hydrogenedentes bacterium]|nr:AAA family ATPase [Candidatus Hydrogenedentota bacterium]
MLKHLSLKYVGPAERMQFEFAPRLNVLTGDNGLGKTFILDIAWWVLTRTWAGQQAWPRPGRARETKITYSYEGRSGSASEIEANFDPKTEEWATRRGRPGMPGLVLYVRVDGGFSVWDPARNYWRKRSSRDYDEPDRPDAFNFTPGEVWNGIEKSDGQWLCNGLLRDWVAWEDRNSREFGMLKAVLRGLSPGETEIIQPGSHTRVSVSDSRDIPTIELPYGTVPVTLASAGMRRILALAYLVVWAHTEHQAAAKLIGDPPADRFTVLVDEVEAHLHPQWQRTILPALMEVIKGIDTRDTSDDAGAYANIQVIATTHAPLVMASLEPIFDDTRDKVFNFDVVDRAVTVQKFEWRRMGDATAWLTNKDVFNLRSGRSIEAENTIEEAASLMKNGHADAANVRKIHERLQRLLGDTDPFWIRWVYVAERKGWLDDTGTAEA